VISRCNFGELTKCTVSRAQPPLRPWSRGVPSPIPETTASNPSILANADTRLQMACTLPSVAWDANPMIDMQPSYGRWLSAVNGRVRTHKKKAAPSMLHWPAMTCRAQRARSSGHSTLAPDKDRVASW